MHIGCVKLGTDYLHRLLWRLAPCKVIQESPGFRIPRCGFRIPCLWIPDSISSWIPAFKNLFSGFQRFFCTLFSLKKACSFLPEVCIVVDKNIILGREDSEYRCVSEVNWVHIVEEILTRKGCSYFNNGVNNNKRGTHCQTQCFLGSNIIVTHKWKTPVTAYQQILWR